MSRLIDQVESLTPARFILLIGAIGGTLQSIPVFFHISTLSATNALIGGSIFILVFALPVWICAALLWWFATRRRQFPIWLTALHVTLGLAVADLLHSALDMVAGSIDSKGALVASFGRVPSMAILSPIELALIRSPFWFVEALALIAVGRHLLRIDTLVAPQRST